MLGRVVLTIALASASILIGVFYQAKRRDYVTPQLAPAPKATATVHHYPSGNGHPVPW